LRVIARGGVFATGHEPVELGENRFALFGESGCGPRRQHAIRCSLMSY